MARSSILMRRRLFWLLGGWIVGALSAAWLRRRVRQGVSRYAPVRLRQDVADRSSALFHGIRRIAGEIAVAGQNSSEEARYARRDLNYGSTRQHRRPIRLVPNDR
ncbi:MAG: hypothetical protein P8M16_00860 [Acidimicrobiales bacterium]|nr:hypothetical protein [Acidimicrobiales bacterium]